MGSLEPVETRRLRAEPGSKADHSFESAQPTDATATEPRRLTDTWAGNLPFSRDRAVDLASCAIHINNLIITATKLGYQTWSTVHGCKYGGPGAVPGMLCSSGVLTSTSFIPWLGQQMAALMSMPSSDDSWSILR